MFTGIIVTAIICLSVVAITVTPIINDYKLKKEKIKADAMVRAEEIRAKNQLDIEKLLLNRQPNMTRFEEEENFDRNPRLNKERL